MKTVYFDHRHAGEPPPPFRGGEAGWVWMSEEGIAETESHVVISPNSLHALHGHGVVDQLNTLDLLLGRIGDGKPAVLAPGATPAASRIFYEADRLTYGARHDLRVDAPGLEAGAPGAEYRILVDNREYQRTLSQLQFLATGAMRNGYGVLLTL